MLTGPVARRYAEAVFEIGVESDSVDAWLHDVRLLAEYFTNRQLIFILGEPNIPFARKEAIVKDLLGDKIRPEAMGLALAVVQRGIVPLTARIRDSFELLYDNYRGQAMAKVTSALPLDDTSRASIIRQLEHMTGKRILLEEAVDPSLLGGVVTRVGDTLIDGSVRRKLELLRRQIAQGGDGGDPLNGFDDVKPLLDLPGSGGVARPLPPSTPAHASDDAAGATSSDSAPGGGSNGRNPAGGLALSGAFVGRGSQRGHERGHERGGAHGGRRGKGRRR